MACICKFALPADELLFSLSRARQAGAAAWRQGLCGSGLGERDTAPLLGGGGVFAISAHEEVPNMAAAGRDAGFVEAVRSAAFTRALSSTL